MAQRGKSVATRARLLARRYGITGRGGAYAACAALLAALVAAGLLASGAVPLGLPSLGGTGLVIERGDNGAARDYSGSQGAGTQDIAKSPADDERATGGGDEADGEPQTTVVVHVDGAVASPGVYAVTGASPRVNDVVALAGGLTPDAQTASVNLAAPVADGQKVHIPVEGEQPAPAQADVAQPAADVAGTQASPQAGSLPVNINTASREELTTLTGVGEATAAAIVEERETNGPFSSPEDLMRVSGIGEKKLAKIRGSICV